VEKEGTGLRMYLHPVEFHSIPPPRNILIRLNPCHTSQLLSSLLVNVLKFSTYFLSTVYCMSQPSRIHWRLTAVVFSLLYDFPRLNKIPTCSPCIFIFFTLQLIVCIGLLFQVFHFTVKIAREGITQYCGRLLLYLEMWRILGLQTRIIGQRRFIDCVRQLKLYIVGRSATHFRF
jgi:hypothetical protein